MEEVLQTAKKQLLVQKMISAFLAVIIVILLAAGVMFANRMNQMADAMTEAAEKLQEIDVEGINDSIAQTQEMMQSVDDFSAAVDDVTARVEDFDSWMSGIFGK